MGIEIPATDYSNQPVMSRVEQLLANSGGGGGGASAAEIAELRAIINNLNGDATTEGSIKYQIKQAVDGVIAGAPGNYDTLKEISDELENALKWTKYSPD